MNFCHYAKFFFSFSLNEDVLTRTVFFHENVLEKRIKKFIQRCYKERSFYNPWQNYFREEKKKSSPTCKAHLSAVTQESWNQLDGEFFFFFMDETQCWCYGGALGVYSRRSAEFWHFSTVFNLNHARLTAAQVNYLVNSGSLTL